MNCYLGKCKFGTCQVAKKGLELTLSWDVSAQLSTRVSAKH